MRRIKISDHLRAMCFCGKSDAGMIGARAKRNLSIGTSVAGWNLTGFYSNLAFIGGQNASVAKVCESCIRIKNYVEPPNRTGMFQRGGHRRSTVGGALCLACLWASQAWPPLKEPRGGSFGGPSCWHFFFMNIARKVKSLALILLLSTWKWNKA